MKHKKEKYFRTGRVSFTPKEVEKILGKVSNLEDRVLFLLAIISGIRREDIVKIRIKDINIGNRTILFFEKKKDRIKEIPIPTSMAQELEIYINTLNKDEKRLFPFSGKTAYNKIQRLCDKAGIPRRPFHALRSTCVKLAQSRGWTPEQVAELTGDSIRVIQEHYSVPNDVEMKEVTEEKPIWGVK